MPKQSMVKVDAVSKKCPDVERAVARKLKDLKHAGFNVLHHEVVKVTEGLGDRANVSIKIIYDLA